MISDRWPLHPRPFEDELLSSWLWRISEEYRLTLKEFFHFFIKADFHGEWEININTSEELIEKVSTGTGINVKKIRQMTLKNLVPSLIDHLDSSKDLLFHYTSQYRILLNPSFILFSGKRENSVDGVLPWVLFPFNHCMACPKCLQEDRRPYLRIHWCLALFGSCPIHKCKLVKVRSYTDLFRSDLLSVEESSTAVRYLDSLSWQAFTVGEVKINGERTSAMVYFRFLRSLIEELFSRNIDDSYHVFRIRKIWTELKVPYVRSSYPFERLTLAKRLHLLDVAGMIMWDFPHNIMKIRRVNILWDYALPFSTPFVIWRNLRKLSSCPNIEEDAKDYNKRERKIRSYEAVYPEDSVPNYLQEMEYFGQQVRLIHYGMIQV